MFKERLKRLMRERQLNQRQLGMRAGIPVTTISGWLNAGRLPDYIAIEKLIHFFNVSADYFFENEEA